MTVRINKPALNLREELTKAQGVVRYEQRQLWMDGLVENGTFDNDLSGWTDASVGTGSAVWSSGVALLTSVDGNNRGVLDSSFETETGKSYILIMEVGTTGTNTVVYLGTYTGNNSLLSESIASSGSASYAFTATTAKTYIRLYGATNGAGTSTFDNVRVFEVDENDNVIHSVPLGFKPVHVYEDGLLQREGDVHDYTVVKTGGAYAIKPAVQPTATTETCIIAEREL